ncbi:MAG: phenylalanine--tRNA ligase subunit beta [Christensenellaceae bacterium]|jgi:phenylalanyl-tRNA synthetase beta chain|nr:phenylalanine--tRNA ligase subunit beta [Christensenellaceae bacterium]
MKLPLSWLKEYVDYNVSNERFVELMMWRGFETASVEPALPVTNVVVGKITALTRHPNADKLQVCTLDIGEAEPVTIVTGAANVFEGALVPVALNDAVLVGGVEIHTTTMRGVRSEGMLCSGKELGITGEDYPGAGVNGILILQGAPKPGQPIQQALGMEDVVFEIELTPNRADCQSIVGICREAAAALGQAFCEPPIKAIAGEGSASQYASVEVLAPELCPRYAARVVKNIRIQPSPAWMQKKLKAVGLRPINNIVDITNYVMVEYGHPMHAFDLACVQDGHIIVRTAFPGEKVTTLDSKVHDTTPDMLLIADPQKGVGIAGVMGGENSEITGHTQTVLFEAAVFKSSSIRRTTRELRHVTDAAARFIKGVEPVNALLAVNRAIELVAELNAGDVVGDVIDVCSVNTAERVVYADVAHVNRILSTAIPAAQMAKMLAGINIHAKAQGETLQITVPHYRVDIESSIETDWDIAEEIGRLYGYDNIAPTLMRGDTFRGQVSEACREEDAVKDLCVALGYYEMYNYNFTGPAVLQALRLPEGDEKRLAVKLLNPFGEDQSLMRTTLIPGMLDTLARNCNRKTGQRRFFEVGNVHFDNNADLPEERRMLGLIVSGAGEDFFTLKGSIEALLAGLGLSGRYAVQPGGGAYFQPGQKAHILVDGEVVGELGAIHPAVQKDFDVPQKAYAAELCLPKLMAHKAEAITYKPLPRYPVVPRDIAVVVDEAVTSYEVTQVICQAPVKVLLEDAALFDVYRGKGIPEGKKSMAYSFTLRAEDKTLNDEDISAAMEAILRSLHARLGAELRG